MENQPPINSSNNQPEKPSCLGDGSTIPSRQYRLMICFAHSTMVMYAKTIVSHDKMSVGEFMDKNQEVMKRVFDEGLTIMEYELSHEQMSRASLVYLQAKHFPSSILETEAYVPR